MVITYLGDHGFLIKTKMADITCGQELTVGELKLTGPGEYEVGDIQIKGYPGAYLFSSEELNLLYVASQAGLSEETIKGIEEDINVLLLSLSRDAGHVKTAVKTMNDLDPQVTLPTIDTVDHPFCKEVGGCPEPVDEFKVSQKDLTEGLKKVVLLHARSRARR